MSKKEEQVEQAEMSNPENTAQEEQTEQSAEELQQEENVEESPVDTIAKLELQLKESNDKYLRLYSDFENFRRRTSKERLDLLQSAGADIIRELLPVLDDFDRAANSNKDAKDIEAVIEGFSLIQNKLFNILSNKGLKPMNTEVGADFDTDKHEAITNIPAPSPELSGKVVDIVEKGFLHNEKVIRFAKVVVGQ